MEGNFSYTIDGKARKFFIGTYAVEKSLSAMGASISELTELFSLQYFALLRNMMFYSAEYVCEISETPVDFKPIHMYQWIDQTGGANGEFIQQFTAVMLPAMGINVSDEPAETPEKKSKPEKS
jgi:hypothetical protein